METRFKIVYTDEAYQFLRSLPEKVQDKIAYNIFKSRVVINKELFKNLEGTNIWEFRTLYNGACYRLLAFWDTAEDTLVIATHGFIKKTQKTPSKEIDKAEDIRRKYFNDKNRRYETIYS